ncbi:hypothetical protein BVX94_03525 [bacterium B17]|nr:hypothetical protein BVX94_03525 [bacterium B17]
MMRNIKSFALLFLVLLFPCVSRAVAPSFDFGPFFSVEKSIEGYKRLRVLGPFFEKQTAEDGSEFFATRPLFCSVKNGEDGRVVRNILWPLGWTSESEDRDNWRMFPFGGWSPKDKEADGWRFMGFPLIYAGETREGDGYFAFFPIGGVLKGLLFRDRISFVLFPLYMYMSINDVESWDVLWPFISWTKGDGVKRFRVFPFYGMSEREDRWKKQFIMWPIWSAAKYSFPGGVGRSHILFPIYGHALMEDQETWWVVPPFFRWTKGDKRNVVNCPWPLIQYASGDLKKFYIFPLLGRKSIENLQTAFFLWPIVTWEKTQRRTADRERLMVFPIYYNEKVTAKDSEKDVLSRYTKVWPLVSYRREGDVNRVWAPDLWPGKHKPSIDRNFSPLWTLYSRVESGDAVDHELLWGLFKKRKGTDGSKYLSLFPLFSAAADGQESKKWSFLFGLLGYEREKLQKTYRLLYFPIRVGGTK